MCFQGISINDIMDKSVFRSDQRTYVLEAIRRHSPNFTPAYSAPNLSYNNELLNFMNKDIRPIEELPYNTVKRDQRIISLQKKLKSCNLILD